MVDLNGLVQSLKVLRAGMGHTYLPTTARKLLDFRKNGI